MTSEQMGSKEVNSHLPSQQECTETMQIPVNSVPPGEAEIEQESQKNEETLEEPVDSESVKGIFGWETVDDTSIPYILRRKKKFVSVRIVECKLLSKYPNTFPDELGKKDPLVSYFITETEASLLNEINTAHCDFDYGHSPFTVKDLIVDLEEFEEFFRIVKKTFPAEVLAKIGGEPSTPVVTPVVTPAVKTELSQFCGWIQINNTVSPYILRLENGRQIKLVPLSVIVYAAGLLTNTSIDGLLPTPHECAMLNEACKAAGFDFLFGKNTRLISISEVLHRCQVQIFELPFKNPLQHARYLDPCTGQPSSNPLMAFMPHQLNNSLALQQHQPPPSMKAHQRVLDLMSGNAADFNPYMTAISRPAFHPSQLTVPGGLSGVGSRLSAFREPSPSRMHHPGSHAGMGIEASRFHSPRSQGMADKNLDSSNSLKQDLSGGSPWAAVPRLPPPAHANSALNSIVSKTLPVSPDPPISSAYQIHSLPPNPLLHSRASPALPDLNHPIFRGPMNTLQRSPGIQQQMHKDHPSATVRYPPPVTGLPLPPPPYPHSSAFPFGVNQFDSSLFARTDQKLQRPPGDKHILSSQPKSQQQAGDESLKYLMSQHKSNSDQKVTNSESRLDLGHHIITTCGKNQPKADMSNNISACLVNGKSISCINVDLPQRKGRFCLVEAVSKLYFPTVPLSEFVKVLQVVLKVNLHECTSQEETAFVQYYNLPVNKLKCNKIIKVDDLEAYFPQLNYMFTKFSQSSPGPASPQPPAQQPSPSHVAAPKRRLSSPIPGPASKMLHPKIENVVRMLNQGKDTAQNGDRASSSTKSSIIVIDDE